MTETEWLTSDDPAAMLARTQSVDLHNTPHTICVSDRKLRLFACACCRQVWHLLTDPRSREAVEVAEQFADGEVTGEELRYAMEDAGTANSELDDNVAGAVDGAFLLAAWVADDALKAAQAAASNLSIEFYVAKALSPAIRAALLRDIIGNLFRPVSVWVRGSPYITPIVLAIAQAAYEERNPDGTLLPVNLLVLSDALEEAGCPTHETIQTSCHNCNAEGFVQDAYDRGMHFLCSKCDGTKRQEVKVSHPLLAHLRSPAPHVRGCWALDLILGKE